jgi:hypothetical protein
MPEASAESPKIDARSCRTSMRRNRMSRRRSGMHRACSEQGNMGKVLSENAVWLSVFQMPGMAGLERVKGIEPSYAGG